jgi:hypothetical protein
MRPHFIVNAMKYILTAAVTAALLAGSWYWYAFNSSSRPMSDTKLVQLFEDLKADCLDGYGEHAKLACQRALSVGQEIQRRGLVH